MLCILLNRTHFALYRNLNFPCGVLRGEAQQWTIKSLFSALSPASSLVRFLTHSFAVIQRCEHTQMCNRTLTTWWIFCSAVTRFTGDAFKLKGKNVSSKFHNLIHNHTHIIPKLSHSHALAAEWDGFRIACIACIKYK